MIHFEERYSKIVFLNLSSVNFTNSSLRQGNLIRLSKGDSTEISQK
jgi:hypothetical protein